MEQHTKDNLTASKISPHQKDLKQHHPTADTPGLNDNIQRVATTSTGDSSDIKSLEMPITH